jgi:ferredoxin-NADP reductase
MINLAVRALTHPRDYLPILRKHTLTFIEQRPAGDSYHSFIFKPEQPLTWQAGQHGILSVPTSKQDKGWRPFSVASAPQEGVIQIGTLLPEPHSEFKEVLLNLTPGSTVTFRGPYGEFHASEKPQQIVGIAGGIGITPFRSIAHAIAHNQLTHTRLHLIYATKDSYPYRNELDTWATQSDQLCISYTRTPEETQAAISNQWNIYGNTADYFISGSPGMITGVKQHCSRLGVRNIVNDPFKGY